MRAMSVSALAAGPGSRWAAAAAPGTRIEGIGPRGKITLAGDVAKAYFALRSLDSQVEATRRTLGLREEGLRLQQKRFDGGVISEFDYRQLEAEVAAARAQLPPLERDREIQEAALAVLLGRSPKELMEGSVSRIENSNERLLPVVVPSGLPSELLLRRPDLVEAEQRLIAANARVAVARTQMFPSIQLTGFLGSEAQALSSLFTGPAGIFQLAAAVAVPIFAGGRFEAQVGAAEAREKQALAGYQGAIQNAFREVRAALAAQTRALARQFLAHDDVLSLKFEVAFDQGTQASPGVLDPACRLGDFD